MSGYLNQITLIGRIGKKPEIATTNDNRKIAKFSLATSEYWKDKESGEKKEKTEWHRIVVYSMKLAEIIESYVEAGALVFIEGKLRYEKWVDQQGQEKKLTNIIIDLNGKFIILDKGRSGSSSNDLESATTEKFSQNTEDDDIPF